MGQEKRKLPHNAEIRVHPKDQRSPEEGWQGLHPNRSSKGCLEGIAAELGFEGKRVAWRRRSEDWGLSFGLGPRLAQFLPTVRLYQVLRVPSGLRDPERCLSRGKGMAELQVVKDDSSFKVGRT